jgi:thymidylate synthase (FAD)
MVWTIDLHNLLHLLKLRMSPTAQEEIREYAHEMYKLIQPIAPVTCAAFDRYILNSFTLTRDELSLLTTDLSPSDIQGALSIHSNRRGTDLFNKFFKPV